MVIVLFALTIACTVAFHQYAHLPPFLGMMTGLGALQILGFVIRRRELRVSPAPTGSVPPGLKTGALVAAFPHYLPSRKR